MAEISTADNHNKLVVGVTKPKKALTRVDLTPMVDLGFLLITFFIFTTTMSQPTAMKLVMPDDRGDVIPTKQGGALTLIPAADGQVFYYEGAFEPANVRPSNTREIRNIIIDKKRRTGEEDLFIIIKPVKTTSYADLVNVLDEMTINDVKRYALVDPTLEEETMVSDKLSYK